MSNTSLTSDSVRLNQDLETYYDHKHYLERMISYAKALLTASTLADFGEGIYLCNHELNNLEGHLEMTQAVIEDLEAALAELSGQEANTDV